jgi:hypothetical protein
VYGDLERCDRVAYKSMFEIGFLAGILTSFLAVAVVGLAARRFRRSGHYSAFLVSMLCFSILYLQV